MLAPEWLRSIENEFFCNSYHTYHHQGTARRNVRNRLPRRGWRCNERVIPPCVTTSVTKHDEKSWKREYPQVERAIHQYLGRAALFQAIISGDVHERTKQAGEGGQTKKRVGEPFEEYINVFLTLSFVSFQITFLVHSSCYSIPHRHSAHLSCWLLMFRSPSSCPKMRFWRSKSATLNAF